MDWLLWTRRDLADADYCLDTDGRGGEIRKGRRVANEVQTRRRLDHLIH